jgi:hypothetical protein
MDVPSYGKLAEKSRTMSRRGSKKFTDLSHDWTLCAGTWPGSACRGLGSAMRRPIQPSLIFPRFEWSILPPFECSYRNDLWRGNEDFAIVLRMFSCSTDT